MGKSRFILALNGFVMMLIGVCFLSSITILT